MKSFYSLLSISVMILCLSQNAIKSADGDYYDMDPAPTGTWYPDMDPMPTGTWYPAIDPVPTGTWYPYNYYEDDLSYQPVNQYQQEQELKKLHKEWNTTRTKALRLLKRVAQAIQRYKSLPEYTLAEEDELSAKILLEGWQKDLMSQLERSKPAQFYLLREAVQLNNQRIDLIKNELSNLESLMKKRLGAAAGAA